MTMRLKNLQPTEISLLKAGTRPAVPGAKVVLAKREEQPHVEVLKLSEEERANHERIWAEICGAAKGNSAMTSKPEQELDRLVEKRREKHDDESEAVAMEKVLRTPEGAKLYGEMMRHKEVSDAAAGRVE